MKFCTSTALIHTYNFYFLMFYSLVCIDIDITHFMCDIFNSLVKSNKRNGVIISQNFTDPNCVLLKCNKWHAAISRARLANRHQTLPPRFINVHKKFGCPSSKKIWQPNIKIWHDFGQLPDTIANISGKHRGIVNQQMASHHYKSHMHMPTSFGELSFVYTEDQLQIITQGSCCWSSWSPQAVAVIQLHISASTHTAYLIHNWLLANCVDFIACLSCFSR